MARHTAGRHSLERGLTRQVANGFPADSVARSEESPAHVAGWQPSPYMSAFPREGIPRGPDPLDDPPGGGLARGGSLPTRGDSLPM